MITETTEPVMTDDIRQAAREMYVQVCGAGQAIARPEDINTLAWTMARRTVTGMSEVRLNSPQHKTILDDKNNVLICSVGRYCAFAHCLPAAAPAASAAPTTPAAQPAQAMGEASPRETIIRELFSPGMAYSVGGVVDGKTIIAIKTTGVDEENDSFYPTQYCTVRPATEGEIAAYNAKQQRREDEINKQAARDSARYAQYEF